MRIITGSARGTKLETLDGDATRPTGERVKEAVFSMIQFDVEGRTVLDLFAGSGQLGLEALSRGAARATLIDVSRDAVDIVMGNAKKTHLFDRCRISCADALGFLRSAAGKETYDIIFLDPPYASTLVPESLRAIAAGGISPAGGTVICETDNGTDARPSRRHIPAEEKEASERAAVLRDVFGDDESLRDRFTVRKTVSYGRTRITILTPAEG